VEKLRKKKGARGKKRGGKKVNKDKHFFKGATLKEVCVHMNWESAGD